mmetsp:Transcript_15431/g.15019  ORF Transcript_15431/g.15019 Transcript_15431/m.15019 type:complete len:122 (-) Transcript_15431:101-466(-)
MDLQSRGKREFHQKATVIHVSSIAGEFTEFPKNGDKACSKWFNKNFALVNAQMQLVDDLIIQPGYVQTPLTSEKKLDWNTITTKEEAESIVRAVVGHQRRTYGSYRHTIFRATFYLLPTPL